MPELYYFFVKPALLFLAALAAAPLHAASLEDLFEVLLPPEQDEAWLEIGWETDLWKARERAAKEGKPIFLWEMDGHPLGCT